MTGLRLQMYIRPRLHRSWFTQARNQNTHETDELIIFVTNENNDNQLKHYA